MICFLLLAIGQDLKLPAEVRGEVGSFVTILAETSGKVVKFYPLDSGLSVFPPALLANTKATVVVAAQPGRYRVLAYTAAGDTPSDPVLCTVVIGGAPPGPAPVPPAPNPPAPTPPGPDPLALSIRGIFGGLQEASKAQMVASLAKVFRAVDPATVATLGQLEAALRAQSRGIPATAIQPIRETIAEHLRSTLGENPELVMDEAMRAKARAELARVATILEGLQ
jgi:hypothetical protein